jgi:purine catabolism regulator
VEQPQILGFTLSRTDPARLHVVVEQTVRGVLDLPELVAGAPQLLAGEASLGRAVRWVHVAEIADVASLLRGGELILTTGVAWPASATRLRRHIKELADVGVAGVVLELGRRYQEVPAVVVEVAEREQLPLVALRQEISFVTVTERVHRLLLDAREERLAFANAAHEAFTSLSVRAASAQEVLDRLRELAASPVVLEDLAHRAVAHAATSGEAAELLRDWHRRSRTESEGWLVTSVGPQDQRWGRLVLPRPSTERRAEQQMLLERAAEAITISHLVERDRMSLEQQANKGLLDDLLRGQLSDDLARERAHALGFRTAGRSFVGVRLSSPSTRRLAPVQRQQRIRQLAAAADEARRAARLPALVSAGDSDDALLVLITDQAGATNAQLERLADAVEAALASRAWDDPHVLAVGRPVGELTDARLSLDDARRVAEVVRAAPTPAGRRVVRIDDLGLAGLLSTVRDDPRWIAFAEAQLAPLLEHDARRGSDLEALLLAYVETGGNKSALARVAHLSRPSVYQRLELIEQLLQLDLGDASTVSALHVALLLRRLQPPTE